MKINYFSNSDLYEMRLFFLNICMFLIIHGSFSQQFQNGNYEARVGIGLFLGSISTDKEDINANSSTIASVNYPLYFMYSYTDRWSAGINIEGAPLITVDESKHIQADIRNYGLSFQYRFVNKENKNYNIHLDYGFSGLKWQERSTDDELTANGSFAQTGISYYHFYSNLFGIYFCGDFLFVNYSSVKNKRGQYLTYDYGSRNINIEFAGLKLTAGICFKF